MTILNVTQLNKFSKSVLESVPQLKDFYVKGEISNLSYYPKSGHYYLTLKDELSSIKAVIFSSYAKYLNFIPNNGINIIARCSATIYEKDGSFQLIIMEMMPEGEGERALLLKQLKEKLEKEGLFSEERKKLIPENIKTIGVATSSQGAVLHDIVSVIERKAPYVKVILAPCAVQGTSASIETINAINMLNKDGRADVIIVARGGGSEEDLWGYQNEQLVRTIFESKIPIISAIGHEVNNTLCDLVADKRAATPTAAAEIALYGLIDINYLLKQTSDILCSKLNEIYNDRILKFEQLKENLMAIKVIELIDNEEEKMYNKSLLLKEKINEFIELKEQEIANRIEKIELVNPLNILSRGYSIIKKDECVVSSIKDLNKDDNITNILSNGKIISKVLEVYDET